MEHIFITDVAPRDGLQSQAVTVSTSNKLRLIRALADAGVRSVEATSFVSPKAVPQMADAAEVIAGLRFLESETGLRTSALVPNIKGLERATAVGAREIAVVISATKTMNLKNINMNLAEAEENCKATLHAARASGLATRAYIAVAWECPFEGVTDPDTVVRLAAAMRVAGAGEIVIADTIGAAAPGQVAALLRVLAQSIPLDMLAVHFHDTRGMGAANAYAALEAGVRRFDASVGGIGGCPFAPGAAGNLATEDLVMLAHQCGFTTGINLDVLLLAVDMSEAFLGRPLGGRSMPWLRNRQQQRVAQGS
ncbi:hydroxymethylglutaryl-CoA lyase [Rhodoferax ferrireducens T118]|uniref:Hydroxymethylglutaryl-CoA lyase n=1 Tax=Albidiferax ferrireducens (strain ATCC BAA-621 / DSM 15236 / T118) TaxID=338969 RepID=Q21QR6_ALBFT|nr:hydroxymethylglutaryl-CoA lyase [Rhodoferax ferrireducens]ABD71887.1 hydroxymethylglutaryl-CoA lyase [Rhodoferax ferrireducens T118]